MPNLPVQDIMHEGPGLRDRARETAAVTDAALPRNDAPAVKSPPSKVDLISSTAKFGDRGKEKRLDKDTTDTRPLGSFKHGTAYVPKTGNYKLHEGEAVTPAKDNMKNMYSKITEGDAKPKKEIKEMRVKKTHDGKHVVTHVHHHPMHEDETHVADTAKDLAAHMAAHAGGAGSDGAPAGGGDDQMAQLTASPSPAPAPAPAAGGATPQPGM